MVPFIDLGNQLQVLQLTLLQLHAARLHRIGCSCTEHMNIACFEDIGSLQILRIWSVWQLDLSSAS